VDLEFFLIMIILPYPMPTYFTFTIFAKTIRFIPEIEEYKTLRPLLASTSQRGHGYMIWQQQS
jgi:hypothetical protein